MTRTEALAERLIDLGTKLAGSCPDWTWHDDDHTTGTWHGFRVDLRRLAGPPHPMEHWRVEVTSEGGMGFRSDDLEVYPRRLVSAQYLALYFMRSQIMCDMTS